MTLILAIVAAASAAAAALTWQLASVAKREGVTELFNAKNVGDTFLHLCMLFTWGLLIRDAFGVLFNSAPLDSTAGFAVMFGGLFAMRVAGIKKRQAAAHTSKESRG